MKKNPGRKERRRLARMIQREDGRRRARENERKQKMAAAGIVEETEADK